MKSSKKKQFKIFLLFLIITAIINCFAYADEFGDIKNHWAEKYINEMLLLKYINGYPDGTFKPDYYITKAEAGKIFSQIFDLRKTYVPKEIFSDVTGNEWYTEYICSSEYIFGDSLCSTFEGDDNIKRISVAYAIAKIWGWEYKYDTHSSLRYTDYSADSDNDSILNQNGLISKMTDMGIMT